MKKFLLLLMISLITCGVAHAEERIFDDANEIQLEYLFGELVQSTPREQLQRPLLREGHR